MVDQRASKSALRDFRHLRPAQNGHRPRDLTSYTRRDMPVGGGGGGGGLLPERSSLRKCAAAYCKILRQPKSALIPTTPTSDGHQLSGGGGRGRLEVGLIPADDVHHAWIT